MQLFLIGPQTRTLLALSPVSTNPRGRLIHPPVLHGLAIASIDWGCAVQIAAAAALGSGEEYSATDAETLYVPASPALAPF